MGKHGKAYLGAWCTGPRDSLLTERAWRQKDDDVVGKSDRCELSQAIKEQHPH